MGVEPSRDRNEGEAAEPSRDDGLDRAATARDVAYCYRVLLGREAENDFVIDEKVGRPLAEVVTAFATSGEFGSQVLHRVIRGLAPATPLHAHAAEDDVCDWVGATFGSRDRASPDRASIEYRGSLIELLAGAMREPALHAMLAGHFGDEASAAFATTVQGAAARALRDTAPAGTALTLMCGPVLLGSFGRAKRDEHTPPGARELWDHGLADFARLCGLDDFALVSNTADATSVRPLPLPAIGNASDPLATRNRLAPALRLADLWFASRRDLALRFEGTGTGLALDAYQCTRSDGIVRLLAGHAIDAPIAIATIGLLNPFAPLLLVIRDPAGAIRAFDHVPFPSLARGGVHSAERDLCGAGSDDVGAMAQLSAELLTIRLHRGDHGDRVVARIAIDPAAGKGTEPIYDPDLLEWLAAAMGVAIDAPETLDPAIRAMAGRWMPGASRCGAVLSIPADAVPTLSALIRPLPADAAAQTVTGGMALVDWDRRGAVRSLWVPPLGDWLDRLQGRDAGLVAPMLTISGGDGRAAVAPTWPLAVRIAEPPVKIGMRPPFEIAAEITRPLLRCGDADARTALAVVIVADGISATPLPLLESLARQRGVADTEVLLCRSGGIVDPAVIAALEGLFRGRHRLIDVRPGAGRIEQLFAARELISNTIVLIVDAATILTDPRTVATLATMLACDEVATAGCLVRVVRDDRRIASHGGYTLSHVDLRAAPALGFAPLDLEALGAPATVPVVANTMAALALRRAVLDALPAQRADAGRPAEDDLRLGIAALAAGTNLCTSLVSVHTDRPLPAAQQLGIALPYRLDAATIDRLVNGSTVIQRIR